MEAPLAYGLSSCKNWVLLDVNDIFAGISKETAERVFYIFCTECPTYGFRNNSDLNLTISKQMIRGNEDLICAENIHSTLAGATSKTLEASFVACLWV